MSLFVIDRPSEMTYMEFYLDHDVRSREAVQLR
jgi:hypothetical protein